MLTSQTIAELDEESDRLNVQNALMTLARTGVLLRQISNMQRQLMTTFDSKPEAELAKDIVDIRSATRVLLGLHNLGQEMIREKQ